MQKNGLAFLGIVNVSFGLQYALEECADTTLVKVYMPQGVSRLAGSACFRRNAVQLFAGPLDRPADIDKQDARLLRFLSRGFRLSQDKFHHIRAETA
ncbi:MULTISPECIES: hypothetical protein [Bradyrhizobium]